MEAEHFLRHAEGCTKRPGLNATNKHHMVVQWFAKLAQKCGDVVEIEPRGFQRFRCPKCNAKVSDTAQRAHERRCGGSLRRSGPDIRISGWTAKEKGPHGTFWRPHPTDMFFDVTVVHTTAPSHIGNKSDGLDAVVLSKLTKYHDELQLIPRGDLTVLPLSARGRMHPNVLHFLERAASILECPPKDLAADLSALLQHANGDILSRAFGWRGGF
jgi:hypothetical protein